MTFDSPAFSLARHITKEFGGDWHGSYGSIPTPGHSHHDRGTTVRDDPCDPTNFYIGCFNGEPLAAKAFIRDRLQLPRRHLTRRPAIQWQRPIPARITELTADQLRYQSFARRIWRESETALGTIAETYIRKARCIEVTDWPASLRFHPRCPRGKGLPPHPALVAAITDPVTGEFKAIHRIYLRPDGMGKADLPRGEQKMSLGPARGGAVVLGDLNADDTILEGEGIETTLTACWIKGLPGIATLSASTLGKPPLPPGRAVTILADRGAEDAAQRAAHLRLSQGREALIASPPEGCKDFNDTVRR